MVTDTPYLREPGYARRYRDRRFRTGSGPRTHRLEAAALAALLDDLAGGAPVPAGRWLDVPSGAGRMTGLLPQPVVGVDRDPAMLAAGGADGGPRVCASATALPFADASFAGVLCLRLLHHLERVDERGRVFRELRRVSRGPVILSYFDSASLQHLRRRLRRRLGKRRSGRVAIRWACLRGELEAAGLRVIRRRPLSRWVSEQTLVLASGR